MQKIFVMAGAGPVPQAYEAEQLWRQLCRQRDGLLRHAAPRGVVSQGRLADLSTECKSRLCILVNFLAFYLQILSFPLLTI